MHEHVQAFRCSTGLFGDFETEPRSNSSKKNEDVYSKCLSFYLTKVVLPIAVSS